MLFKNITITDENFDIKENMYVGTKGDRIAYVSDKAPTEDFGEVINGTGRLLIPAFFNTHSHLSMALMRGYGESLTLMSWLSDKIFPFEAKLTSNDMYYGCLMGAAEMLRFGICSVSDMYLDQDATAKALIESGVKANVSQACVCPDVSDYRSLPLYKNTLKALSDYNGYDNGRIKLEFSLHAEYTSNEGIARGIAEAAAENNSSMHVHVSETQSEVDACKKRHNGKSPVRYLADCGLFSIPCVAAHCVHIDDEDIAILRDYNVSVASCPKSHAKLASGISPVHRLIESGVSVSIGTDSVASNNNLNMIEEMKFLSLLQKAEQLDPTIITPKQVLYAATRAGALAQGRSDSGLIKEGFKADLTVINTDNVYMKPVYNMLNNLIYSAAGGDVVMTVVDGKILYKDGEYTTLDVEKIVYECEKSRLRILGSLADK